MLLLGLLVVAVNVVSALGVNKVGVDTGPVMDTTDESTTVTITLAVAGFTADGSKHAELEFIDTSTSTVPVMLARFKVLLLEEACKIPGTVTLLNVNCGELPPAVAPAVNNTSSPVHIGVLSADKVTVGNSVRVMFKAATFEVTIPHVPVTLTV